MVPPDDDSFEIAQRLDRYGAGKGPTRPPRRTLAPPKPSRKPGRNASRWMPRLLFVIVIGAAVYWWFSGQEESSRPKSSFGQVRGPIPSSNPPQTIPALHGEGTVPAFTVQVPRESTSPAPDLAKDPKEQPLE